MDFAVFSKTEMEEMFQTMVEHMPEDMRNIAIREFKSVEQWKEHYVEVVSSEKMQKGYAKPSPRRLQKATTNGLKQFCKNEYRQQWKRIMQFTQQTNPAESPAQNVPQDIFIVCSVITHCPYSSAPVISAIKRLRPSCIRFSAFSNQFSSAYSRSGSSVSFPSCTNG